MKVFVILVRKAQRLQSSNQLRAQLSKDIQDFGRIRNDLIHHVECNELTPAKKREFREKYKRSMSQIKNIRRRY